MFRSIPIRWMIIAVAIAVACGGAFPAGNSAAAARPVFPEVILLPDGWMAEGIEVGRGTTFYAGSRANGAVYRGDLRTGEGEVFVEGVDGRVAVGLKYHERCDLLLVGGAGSGQGYVFDGTTGEELVVFQFTTGPAFINDVAVTNDTAYFTNSQQAELYVVDLSDCENLSADDFEVLPLTGEWDQVSGFNANGIVVHPSGRYLIVVNSTTGNLYRVDPETGDTVQIDLGGEGLVSNGDGLLLQGQTVYVVRNRLNEIAVVELNRDWTSGEVVDTLTDDDFDVPTTAARFGNALYAVNGRFTTPPGPDVEYQVVRVELR